jgi:prophage antirepressor-like protein
MNELTIFQNDQFGSVRVIEQEGEPWFVAAGVCRVLEISNPSVALERLNDERAKFNLGRQGETNHGGVSLCISSRRSEESEEKRL